MKVTSLYTFIHFVQFELPRFVTGFLSSRGRFVLARVPLLKRIFIRDTKWLENRQVEVGSPHSMAFLIACVCDWYSFKTFPNFYVFC